MLFYCFREQGLYGVAYALIGAGLTRLVISIVYYYKFPRRIKHQRTIALKKIKECYVSNIYAFLSL